MDARNPKGPETVKACELFEFSFVSVPAVRSALVTAKAAGSTRAGPKLNAKGLYEVSRVASVLGELNWAAMNVAWEAYYEEDGSPVPQMLFDCLQQLGEALIQLTAEEVAELPAAWRNEGWGSTVAMGAADDAAALEAEKAQAEKTKAVLARASKGFGRSLLAAVPEPANDAGAEDAQAGEAAARAKAQRERLALAKLKAAGLAA